MTKKKQWTSEQIEDPLVAVKACYERLKGEGVKSVTRTLRGRRERFSSRDERVNWYHPMGALSGISYSPSRAPNSESTCAANP